jgi:hypothetical protein
MIGIIRKIAFIGLLECLLAPLAQAGSPVFIGLAGQVTEVSQQQLLADLKSDFAAPLQAGAKDLKTYFKYQTDGAGRFSLGLITESTDESGESILASYINNLEKSGFHGYSVKFKKVTGIHESVDLQAGVHRPGTEEGSFDSNSEMELDFKLTSVLGWETFTDKLGSAFLSKQSSDFLGFLSGFLSSPADYQNYITQVLVHDDVVFAELGPTLQLEGGAEIGPSSDVTPFFNIPFERNCWTGDFEHGMCYSPSPGH